MVKCLNIRKNIGKPIYRSSLFLTTGRELQFKPNRFVTLIANIRLNYVSGNTEYLNYAGNDGTCDHSWLTMLLGTMIFFFYMHSNIYSCLFRDAHIKEENIIDSNAA